MKQKFNVGRFLLMFVVCGGLYLITGSFFMTLGIMILLLLVDQALAQYEKRKKERQDIDEQ